LSEALNRPEQVISALISQDPFGNKERNRKLPDLLEEEKKFQKQNAPFTQFCCHIGLNGPMVYLGKVKEY
jgi:hypothetical protein